jgi:hypothetical protein
MRTTLELDDDILAESKQLAGQKGETLGRVISDLVRKSLSGKPSPKVRNGVLLFTPRPGAAKPDLNLVNELRDEE